MRWTIRHLQGAAFSAERYAMRTLRLWQFSTFLRLVQIGLYPSDWGGGKLDALPTGEP
jgi:hypothetical protein